MQSDLQPPTAGLPPIIIPSAPILPEHRLVFGNLAPEHTRGTPSEPPNKKRKKDRACDYCRRRKIKCDGPWREGQVCTNCAHGHRRCTYVETSKPRGPSKTYVTALEDKVERLEGFVKQLCPNTDFAEVLGPPILRGSWKNVTSDEPRHPSSSSVPKPLINNSSPPLPPLTMTKSSVTSSDESKYSAPPVGRTTHLIFQPPRSTRQPFSQTQRRSTPKSSVSSSSSSSSNESSEETVETGRGGRQRLTLSAMEGTDETQPDSRIRFHGRSSTAGLVEVTRKFKHLCLREKCSQVHSGDIFGDRKATGSASSHKTYISQPSNKPANEDLQVFRRLEFWSTPKWELDWESHNIDAPDLIAAVLKFFPSDDVANRLFDLFFRHTNTYLPLLHRPTFERQWQNQLHHSNIWFATVCILMFAVASRWYAVGEDSPTSPGEDWKAVGWRWFFVALDVHCIRPTLSCPATLFEIQTFVLMVSFLRGTTCGPVGWLFVSIGIRKALDRGAHRRKVYKTRPNANDELWKRAFWILIAFDHILGASMGRGIAVNEEDHDLDLPIEVDDEYWETNNPETDFKQPAGVPSSLCYFTQFIKLVRIIAFTTKTLYPIDRSKVLCGFVKYDWTGEAVRQLRLAMDEWIQNVPMHLRWSNDIVDSTFAHQSSSIYALYHCVQMTIWRPFCVDSGVGLRLGDNMKTTSAMGHCAVSIKACSRILKSEMMLGISNIPIMVNAALVCAGTLAMILWELQRKLVADGKGKLQIRAFEIEGTGIYVQELLDDVSVCTRLLESTKSRWEWAETVLNKLKDALPTDTGESFESLDMPMPSMDEISSFMRVPTDFGETPALSDPQGGAGRHLHQMDTLRSAYSQPLNIRGLAHRGINSQSQTNQSSFARPPKQTQPSNGRLCIPHRQTSSLTSTLSSPGQSLTHEATRPPQHPSFRFDPQTLPGIGSRPSESHFQVPDRQPPISESRFHRSMEQPSTRELNSPTDRPRHSESGVLRGGHCDVACITERSVASGGKSMLQWEHSHPPRTRTTSLVSGSVPSAMTGREIPCISSSLRRTSYPNLDLLRKEGQASLSTVDNRPWAAADVGTRQDFAQSLSESVGRPFSSLSSPGNSSPPALSHVPQLISHLPKPGLNVTGWNDNTIFATLEDNDRKTTRAMEFRHWNKRPLPPQREADSSRYTQHQFVHEMPAGR